MLYLLTLGIYIFLSSNVINVPYCQTTDLTFAGENMRCIINIYSIV